MIFANVLEFGIISDWIEYKNDWWPNRKKEKSHDLNCKKIQMKNAVFPVIEQRGQSLITMELWHINPRNINFPGGVIFLFYYYFTDNIKCGIFKIYKINSRFLMKVILC